MRSGSTAAVIWLRAVELADCVVIVFFRRFGWK